MKSLVKNKTKQLNTSILFILPTFIEYLLCARTCVTYENTMTRKTWLLLSVFKTALLYNSYTIQFTHLMCTIHWVLVYSELYNH